MGKTFFDDLGRGKGAEAFARTILLGKHPTLVVVAGKNPDYDLIDDTGYTVEVKYDEKSEQTGNIAFERRHRGVDAGIMVSKSRDWFVIYFLKRVGWVWTMASTKEVRAFIVSNQQFLKEYCPTDLDKSELWLVDTEDFANRFGYCKILDKGNGEV